MTAFRSGTKAMIFIILGSSIVLGIIAVFFTQAEVTRATASVMQEKENNLAALASRTELRLQDAAIILQLAAKQDEAGNVLYADSISEQFKGLSPDMDPSKRQIAKDLLSTYQDFETMAFILPNGDIYFVEPYAAQQNLPRLNFAYREWYQGIIASQSTHVGEVIISAATGHRVVPIAVAVFSPNDDTAMTGIFVGALDLDVTQQKLRENKLGTNEYILITDHKGSIVADSRIGKTDPSKLESALDLGGIGKALSGNIGSTTEMIDGTTTLIAYRPIKALGSNWAIVSLQPHSDAFKIVDTISSQSIMTIALIAVVSGTSGYFLYRAFQHNSTLTRRLEEMNEDLKHKTEKLQELDKEKEEFSAMITHELKTPLVPVIGYSELLLDGTLGELTPKQKEKAQVINNSATSLLRLISDLLDARKLELGKMKLDICDVSAKEIVEQCIDGLRLSAKSKEIDLNYSVQDNLEARCDSKRIQQVLYNLLTNAMKFVDPGIGRVEITVVRQTSSSNGDGRSALLFTVKDNGAGIPKDKQGNLFKKFYQADTSLGRKAGGTGLGLAISRGIVEAHGGKIWFESDGEDGKGSTFYFTLPEKGGQHNENGSRVDLMTTQVHPGAGN